MKAEAKEKSAQQIPPARGLFGLGLRTLLTKFRTGRLMQPRLALLERISLAPRQSLALVEAEGRRFLVATSAEGGPAFFALDSKQGLPLRRAQRVSW